MNEGYTDYSYIGSDGIEYATEAEAQEAYDDSLNNDG